MSARSLLSISDLTDDDLEFIVSRGAAYAARKLRPAPDCLSGRILGIYFRKTSTRTRTGFSAAALRLGAQIISFGPHDLQENTGETIEDTARVLGRMLDGLVARTAGPHAELAMMAAQGKMSVINAMSAEEHPTQALADLSTLQCRFGKIEGLHILYVGEGNNTAAALALALTRFRGTELELRTPPGYGLEPGIMADATTQAAATDARIEQAHDMESLPPEVDVVYTTRWQTTGTVKPDPDWRAVFGPFQVDDGVMGRYPAALFMHDLPAHRGEEVSASVLDGPASIAFEQAENKLHSAIAVLEWCFSGQT